MNSSFRFLAAGLAAILALVSCNKENPTKTDSQVSEGDRVITVSFSPATKSSLDGFQPKFQAGDKIAVFDNLAPSGKKEYSVVIDDKTNIATITIPENDFQKAETLNAVYPANAWKDTNPFYTVSTAQDGTFANANICTATINPDEIKATFSNQTAIFKIEKNHIDSKTTYIEVITLVGDIANSYSPSEKEPNLKKIRVQNPSNDVFVSILVPSGLTISDLSFANGSCMKTVNKSDAVSINTIYTVGGDNWNEPYIELAGLKWATKNIGASSETDSGLYFSWGEVKGHDYKEQFTFVQLNPDQGRYTGGWNATDGFKFCNTPYAVKGGTSYNKYSIKEKFTILELTDDAANANWHGSWRMPTSDELKSLTTKNPKWANQYNGKGLGFTFSEGTTDYLFFPACSYGEGLQYGGNSNSVYYWSSSVRNDDNYISAYCLAGSDTYSPTIATFSRFYGLPIRAVSD